ncbi:hypothetical protein F4821DRAFT_115120 [Hypoxylon rubiginosum]|uniref:Uncharacterized protein n=1 Tax=Hypoxylon rubiginosum TaxID=110542 RepID=A0ACC0D480_9PEZI|nr:hypothetical protein F4821DRAFT_115120 [Hypoxylon rubiginosum]
MAIDDSSQNPFIRFKNRVDSNIQQAFQALLGSSVIMGKHNSDERADNTSTRAPSQGKDEGAPSGSDDKGSATADDVLSWAISSPYSPLNLQSLPQPQPTDAANAYPKCFTFRDAFEDLLAVNSGRTLSSLQDLVLEKHLEHIRYFPWGLPVGAWAVGLGRRGLWDTYFPLSPSAKRQFSYGPRIFWQTDNMAFHQLPHKSTTKRETMTARGEADVEDELYSAVESEFATSNSTILSELQKALNMKFSSTKHMSPPSSEETPITRTVETPDGGRIVKTVQRRVHDGKNEIIATTQQFDASGKVIASRTRTRRWSSQKISNNSKKSEQSDENESDSKTI